MTNFAPTPQTTAELIERRETPSEIHYYSRIRAYEARNYDGSPAMFQPGTPDGERLIRQRERIDKETGKRSFSNWW